VAVQGEWMILRDEMLKDNEFVKLLIILKPIDVSQECKLKEVFANFLGIETTKDYVPFPFLRKG